MLKIYECKHIYKILVCPRILVIYVCHEVKRVENRYSKPYGPMVLLEFISSNLIAEALQLTELQTRLVLSCVQIPFPAFLL